MDIALIILFLGVLIFLGNSFNRIFALTNIPDLLFLICIGLIIGPVTGLISPASFGIVGPIFTTVILAIILFEGGLHLRVETIKASFGGAIKLTLMSFFLTMIIATIILYFSKFLEFLPSLMLGAIIGGTSSAVVIPMIEFLNLQKESTAILALESAITDVLCIVFFLSILDVYLLGTLDIGITTGKLVASLLMAVILGIIGGLFWSSFYHRLGKIKSIFYTGISLYHLRVCGYPGVLRCHSSIGIRYHAR